MDFKKEIHHRHINYLLLITIFLVIIILLLVKPALVGYTISKNFEEIKLSSSDILKEVESQKTKAIIAETNLESCQKLNNDLVKEKAEEKQNTIKCLSEKEDLRLYEDTLKKQLELEKNLALNNITSERDNIKTQLENKEQENKKLNQNYNILSQNSADNICCKLKVDNRNIDSYIVSNNAIVCTTGEDDKISC